MNATDAMIMSSPMPVEPASFDQLSTRMDGRHDEEEGEEMMCEQPSNNGEVVSLSNIHPHSQHQQRETLGTSTEFCNEGHWTQDEKLLFLKGLRRYGRGKWKKIASLLPTRSNLQVKSHGQKVLAKLQAGEDIFQALHHAEEWGILPASPHRRQHSDMCAVCLSQPASTSYDTSMEEDYADNHSIRSCVSDPLPQRREHQHHQQQHWPSEPSSYASYDEYHGSGSTGYCHDRKDGYVSRSTNLLLHLHQRTTMPMCQHEASASDVGDWEPAALSTSYPPKVTANPCQLPHNEGPKPEILDVSGRDDVETDIAMFLCQLSSSSSLSASSTLHRDLES